MKKLYGTGVALVTPFKKDEKIDFYGLEKLVKYVLDNEVDYLVALGTTAETATLKREEKQDIVECIQSANYKQLPLILGVGGNNTIDIVNQINSIKSLSDFYAVLSVSPYYNRPSQEGIYEHFKSIVNFTEADIIIYNVPKRTGSNVMPETVLRLANNFEKIIGIKEASGNILQSYKIIEKKPKNFSVISGDDFITLPVILGGGEGVISVIAQGFPDKVSQMVSLARKSQVEKSFSIFYKMIEMIDLIYEEGNPTGIKTFLNIIGICNPYVRLPLLIGSSSLKNKMLNLLKQINS
ncbi:dihydrodipicolinate synthase [Blattabacterium sp. (Blattella germanica) str. Bge]|uniref:4-hydroxy-tetrahydrodipicolinate synthase n=1 Tax=Blattabacterium sp. (Blattella germanica) TaxID=624186 RepID=UPI0001BB611E|nr:4-hydroxy-tetrahydrodipicolinate synthase [Blattabacterium sp. (Blattella germanica)]ACY40232.1 dihydrodipicolinate synthase [Blattabacterium sp. (Blattella germanica) str. Bge]